MKRNNAYKKLGLTEADYKASQEILQSSAEIKPFNSKESKVMGYNEDQIKREKAVALLGTTESEIDEVRMKSLAALGHK